MHQLESLHHKPLLTNLQPYGAFDIKPPESQHILQIAPSRIDRLNIFNPTPTLNNLQALKRRKNYGGIINQENFEVLLPNSHKNFVG